MDPRCRQPGKRSGNAPKTAEPLAKTWPKWGVRRTTVPLLPPRLALKTPFQPGKKLAAFTLETPLETEKHLAYRSGNFGGDT